MWECTEHHCCLFPMHLWLMSVHERRSLHWLREHCVMDATRARQACCWTAAPKEQHHCPTMFPAFIRGPTKFWLIERKHAHLECSPFCCVESVSRILTHSPWLYTIVPWKCITIASEDHCLFKIMCIRGTDMMTCVGVVGCFGSGSVYTFAFLRRLSDLG